MVALLALSWGASYRDNLGNIAVLHARNVKLKRALEWIDIIPDNPDLALIFPHVDWLKVNAHTLVRGGLLRLPLLPEALGAAIKDAAASAPNTGYLDGATLDAKGELFISGWAWLPKQKRRAHCVAIGCESNGVVKLLTVFETGTERPDVVAAFGSGAMVGAGFARAANLRNFPRGDIVLRAWAIDLDRREATALRGAIPWHAP